MQMYKNKIQEVIKSKLAEVDSKIRAIKEVQHPGTNGDLRELIIKDLIALMLPKQFSIRSGFICDSIGGCSKQLDIIIIDNLRTPDLLLLDDVSFIPLEAALLVIEIKSVIQSSSKHNKGTIEQVKQQIKSVLSLQNIIINSNEKSVCKVPFILFGFSSHLSQRTLNKFLTENVNVFGVCVYQREYQGINREAKLEIKTNDEDFSELLAFLGDVVRAAELASGLRGSVPRNTHAYIKGIPKSLIPNNQI